MNIWTVLSIVINGLTWFNGILPILVGVENAYLHGFDGQTGFQAVLLYLESLIPNPPSGVTVAQLNAVLADLRTYISLHQAA